MFQGFKLCFLGIRILLLSAAHCLLEISKDLEAAAKVSVYLINS